MACGCSSLGNAKASEGSKYRVNGSKKPQPRKKVKVVKKKKIEIPLLSEILA